MIHRAAPAFWECYQRLSPVVREVADKAFAQLKADAKYPGLHFKKVGRFWSVRVGSHHRALAVETPEGALWFWIGTHAEYDHLVS